MDCKTARLLSEFHRPQSCELEPEDRSDLETHLAECSECGPMLGLLREADDRVAAAMRAVPLPPDGKDRLLHRLAVERGRWWQRRLAPAAAAAAVLLASAAGYGYYAYTHRPALDVQTILEDRLAIRGLPAEQIENWFAETYHIRVVAPRNLNYAYLVSSGREEFEGKLTPRLLFVGGSNYARVLVLSTAQYDFRAVWDHPRAGSGGLTVELRSPPGDPETAYLIEYNSPTLDWLQTQDEPPAT